MREKCAAWFVGAMVFVFGNIVLYMMAPVIYGGPLAMTVLYLIVAYAVMTIIAALLTWLLVGGGDEGGGRR